MALDEKRRQKMLAKKAAARKARSGKKSPRMQGMSAAQAAQFPVGDCLAPAFPFKYGIGTIVLTRTLPGGDVAIANFLVDAYCLGVKDAFYRVVSPGEFQHHRQQFEQHMPLERIHPSCLRKLVEGAVQYARDLGFRPHPDYAQAARLFGDIDPIACPVRYTYGKDGKPFYISGPNETPAQVRRIIETITRNRGSGDVPSVIKLDSPNDQALTAPDQFIHMLSYEISSEPIEEPAYTCLPEPVKDEFEELFYKVTGNNQREAIPALKAMINRYPDVPQSYNYLHSAYMLLGDKANATRVLEETLKRFPNYLFGRIAQAEECLQRGETSRIPEIFEGKFDLKLLYPERKRFHTAEVLGFGAIMAHYFHVLGDKDRAEMYYNLLNQIDPDHRTTKTVRQILFPNQISKWLRMLSSRL